MQNVSDLNSKLVEKEREIHKLIEENISESELSLISTILNFTFFKDLWLLAFNIRLFTILTIYTFLGQIETHTQLTESIRDYHHNKGLICEIF